MKKINRDPILDEDQNKYVIFPIKIQFFGSEEILSAPNTTFCETVLE